MNRSDRSACALLGGGVLVLATALIVVVYRAITGAAPLFPIAPTAPAPVTSSGSEGWYTVYFSDPSSPTAGSFRGGPDAALVAAIDGARLSVDVAAYDLDLWSVRDALLAAHRRGVTVRVVAESDNLDEAEFQYFTS